MAHKQSKTITATQHTQHLLPNLVGKHEVPSTLIKGAVMSAGAQTGKSIMSKVIKHPLLLVGVGMVAGYYAHKYRKEIISSVTSAGDKGKDFVLQQKENLEDIVAESKES